MEKTIFNNILSEYNIDEIEKHLFYLYYTQNKFDYSKCTFLNNYLDNLVINDGLTKKISSLKITSIESLDNYLELLIPQHDKKVNGAFFTPKYIVDFIIKTVSPKIGDRNLDPSCGCGAFLIGLVDYYKTTYNKTIKSIVKDNVFGADILDYNVHRAKLLLCTYALQYGEYLDTSDINISVKDSLNYKWKDSFDNIVGNPPYVKFQDMSDDTRGALQANWETINKGTYNLYFAFFELGYNLIKEGGNLCYITPNNYFTSLAGEPLRNFLQRKKCVSSIIDFKSKKVFDAQTYTAITVIQKKEHDILLYDRINDNCEPKNFLNKLERSPNYYSQLDCKKWRLLKVDEQNNIKQIETIGTPIGKLFDICVGIATLKDDVFFLDSKLDNSGYYSKRTPNGNFKIEKEVTKPVYKISDFKTQQEIATNNRRIICPYIITGNNAVPIPENVFASKYPKCYEYLLSEKQSLLSRDKGKVKYTPFYAWGRTQGLNKFGKKLLNPTFSQTPRFLITDIEESFFTNGYGIFFKGGSNESVLFKDIDNPVASVKNIDVVQKILNSSIMHYYVSKTSVSIEGGYPCYQKNFIEKFSIPFFSNEEIHTLHTLNNYKEIDRFLLTKYHLNLSIPNLLL